MATVTFPNTTFEVNKNPLVVGGTSYTATASQSGKTASGYTSSVTTHLYLTLKEQNPLQNYSVINLQLECWTSSNTYRDHASYVSLTATTSTGISVEPSVKTQYKIAKIAAGSHNPWINTDFTIYHNDQGKADVSFTFSNFSGPLTGSITTTSMMSSTYTIETSGIPTIPRKASISSPQGTTFEIGKTYPINITNLVNGYKVALTSEAGSVPKTLVTNFTGTTYNFAPTLDYLPSNVLSSNCTIRCKTYDSNNNQISDASTLSGTIKLPSYGIAMDIPVLQIINSSDNKFLIQQNSSTAINISNIKAYSSYSNISSYSISVISKSTNSSIYVTNIGASNNSVTLSPKALLDAGIKPGDYSINIQATDSRNQKSPIRTLNFTAINYKNIQLTYSAKVKTDPIEHYSYIDVNDISPVVDAAVPNNSVKNIIIEYKKYGDSSYTLSYSGAMIRDYHPIGIDNTNIQYVVKVTISDLVSSTTEEKLVGLNLRTVDFKASGTGGIAFNMEAAENEFRSNFDSRFYQKCLIKAQSKDGNWYWYDLKEIIKTLEQQGMSFTKTSI